MAYLDDAHDDDIVGKEYSSLTLVMMFAWAWWAGAAMTTILYLITVNDPLFQNRLGLYALIGACLSIAGVLTYMHLKSPQRKYTVLRKYVNEDGFEDAEVRYMDGTTGVVPL